MKKVPDNICEFVAVRHGQSVFQCLSRWLWGAAFRSDRDELIVPEGESLKEFQTRVSEFINNIAQNYLGKRVLLVSHGGAMQRMLKHTTGGIKEPNVRPFCSNASLAVFRCKEGVNWQLVTWNDTAHLEELEQTDLLPL